MKQGYLQVYTGDGKGKTTAALGLALRAVCAGLRVYMGQFLKGQDYSELRAPALLQGRLTIRQYGTERLICQGVAPSQEDGRLAREGIEDLIGVLMRGDHEIVVADEVNVAVRMGVLDVADLMLLVDARPPCVELICTGRGAPRELLERADLVTEMREIKHYYRRGVGCRRGIEN